MAKVSDIEGIGPAYAAKLEQAGISTLNALLRNCCEKKGRQEVSKKAGIGESTILAWVNKADLTRIKGVSTQYADLLEVAGVDSVPELAQRNPENLTAKMAEVNADKNLVRRVPAASRVEDWVAQAKKLPKVVKH